jgi:hypothetical protein
MANKRNANEPAVINVGHVYADEDGMEVTPFFVDRHAGRVRFSPLGRSREMELDIDTFAEDYTYVGVQSAHAEKPKSKSAARNKE